MQHLAHYYHLLHHLRRSSEIGRMLEAAALLLLGSAVSWSGVVWPGEVEMLHEETVKIVFLGSWIDDMCGLA